MQLSGGGIFVQVGAPRDQSDMVDAVFGQTVRVRGMPLDDSRVQTPALVDGLH